MRLWVRQLTASFSSIVLFLLGLTPMTEAQRQRRRLTLKMIRSILRLLLALVLLSLIVAGLVRALLWLATAWSTAGLSDRLQILSFLSNSLLSTILVIATCAYVWVTWRMVWELVEARRIEIRPALAIELGHLQVDSRDDVDAVILKCSIAIINVGAGPAVFPSAQMTVPYRAPKAMTQPTWCPHGAFLEELPAILMPSDRVLATAEIWFMQSADVSEIPEEAEEFAEFEIRFEDSARNLFQHRQLFNSIRIGSEYVLGLMYDRVLMVPFEKRSSIHGLDMLRGFEAESAQTLYERRF